MILSPPCRFLFRNDMNDRACVEDGYVLGWDGITTHIYKFKIIFKIKCFKRVSCALFTREELVFIFRLKFLGHMPNFRPSQ